MKSFLIAATNVASSKATAIKRTIQDIAARFDNNTYVVAVWKENHWQVVKFGIMSRKLALATRNLISANRDIAPSNISVFTTKIAIKYGMMP